MFSCCFFKKRQPFSDRLFWLYFTSFPNSYLLPFKARLKDHFQGFPSIVTCFFSKSTFTSYTPFTADNFSVTALAQPWHFIPVISYVFDIIIFLSFTRGGNFSPSSYNFFLFNLRAFSTTDTELKLMARPANIGFKSGPPKR